MREERLGSVTKTARAEEEERLARLGRLQQEEIPRFRLLVIVLLLLETTSTILLDALHLFSSVFFQCGRRRGAQEGEQGRDELLQHCLHISIIFFFTYSHPKPGG